MFLGIPYAQPPVGNRRWRSPQPPKRHSGVLRTNTLGAGHGSEVPFVFGNLPRSPVRPGAVLAKALGIPNQAYPIVAADVEMSRRMQRYWLNFAKTGNPNGAGLPNWSRFSAANPVTLVFGQDGIREVPNLNAVRLDRLTTLMDRFLQNP